MARTPRTRCSPVSMAPHRSSPGPSRTASSSTSASRARGRPSSSPSEVFDRVLVPAEYRDALSERAWLQALLDVERALAVADARAGLIPSEAAEAIAAACDA